MESSFCLFDKQLGHGNAALPSSVFLHNGSLKGLLAELVLCQPKILVNSKNAVYARCARLVVGLINVNSLSVLLFPVT